MPAATSLASSTATVSSRESVLGPETGRGRKPALLAVAALIGAGTIGALVWSRTVRNDPSAATPSGTAMAAMRRSFVLFIDATPAGAEIWEADKALGQAPMQISIDNEAARREPRRLVVRRPGYQPYSIVQGPSDENVRIIAQLVASAGDSPAGPAIAPGAAQGGAQGNAAQGAPAQGAPAHGGGGAQATPNAPKEHPASMPGKATKTPAPRTEPAAPSAAAPVATAAPAAPPVAPPSASSDIRLQR